MDPWRHPDGKRRRAHLLEKGAATPGIISLAIGLPLFLLSVKLPEPLGSAVDLIAGLNTPLAMVCVGVFIAGVNLKTAFREFTCIPRALSA